jgi:hypothetical protein
MRLHHLENYDLQEILLSKLTQFSQGKTVPGAPATDRHGSLSKDTCISSTQQICSIWNKETLSPP